VDRIPEPELMLDPAQAVAYARADFSEPHDRFVALLLARFPVIGGQGLDLGCGPGDVALRLLRACPALRLDAVDGSPAMVALAHQAAAREEAGRRLRLVEAVLPDVDVPLPSYDLVVSNSLLHHLHRPAVLWDAVRRWSRAGTAIFVMDLLRPATAADAVALVRRYAAGEPAVLQRDFHASLLAAFTVDEIRLQLAGTGLAQLAVEVVSDRHVVVSGHA